MADADIVRDGSLVPAIPPAPPPGAGPALPASDETVMSLVDHLSELRRRLAISLGAVALGAVLGFIFAPRIVEILKAPYGSQALLLLAPGDGFMIYLKIAIATGLVLGMPVILLQLWRFVSPGLTTQERTMARPWVPIALAFFIVGVVVAYLIMPFAIAFLSSFGTGAFQNAWTASEYFGFVTMLFVAFGLVMEYPIVLVLLSKVGIISSKRLRTSRRIVILIIAIVSAVVTPGGDPVSPFILGVTMYILYELSIVLVRAGGR